MRRSRTSALPGLGACFLCGLAFGPAVFLAFFRFEIAAPAVRSAAGFCLAAVLLGWSLGTQALSGAVRRRRAWLFVFAISALALWPLWALAGPGGGWIRAALVAIAGSGVLGALSAARLASTVFEPEALRQAEGPERSRGAQTGGELVAAGRAESGGVRVFLLGAATGFAGCSAGVMGVFGLPVVVTLGAASAVVGAVLGARPCETPRTPKGPSLATIGSWLLLAAAAGAAGATLLRAYLLASRSLAYAASDLGTAFLLGTLVFFVALRRHAGPQAPLMASMGLILVCVVGAFSFLFYPDLIVGESAAMQTSSYALTGGRVFPMWGLAFLLGMSAAPAWAADGRRARAGLTLMAGAAGAAAAGLLAGSYKGPYVLAVALALLASCSVRRDTGRARGSLLGGLRPAALVLGAAALLWCVIADPHQGWMRLRRSAAEALTPGGAAEKHFDRLSVVSNAEPLRARVRAGDAVVDSSGLAAVVTTPQTRAEFHNGNLVFLERGGFPVQGGAPALTVALGLAFSESPARVGVIAPALDETFRALRLIARTPECRSISPWLEGTDELFDVVVCGPGPMSAAGCPLALLSREGLLRVKSRLRSDGVFSLWFPAGRVELGTLRTAIATLQGVFPSFYVFVSGHEAVFVAVPEPGLEFEGLERLFTQQEGRRYLARAGFWHPTELVLGFVAEAGDVGYLTSGVRPFRLSHPRRPPALARDLAAATRPASLAVLVQHRLAGPGRLLSGLRFRSAGQEVVALRGFEDLYREQTVDTLRTLGRMGPSGRRELVRFLYGSLVRAELMAPGQGEEDRAIQVAAALSKFGLPDAAAEVLQKTIEAGRESFAVHFYLAGTLEGLQRPAEALRHYHRALSYQPDSVPTLGRITALQMALGLSRDAAETLQQILDREPNSISALLTLGSLYAGRLGRFKEAAELAVRVLDMDPGNTAAMELLTLSQPAVLRATQSRERQ